MPMPEFQDLTNQKFGRLKIIERAEDFCYPNGRKETRWICKCDCGNIVTVRSYMLKQGYTKSCGCLSKEITTEIGKRNKRYNCFEFKEDYVIGYTRKGERFYIDLEDYEKIKDICWSYSGNYVIGKEDGKHIRLHRLIMNLSSEDKRVVDHINHNTLDNRKSNLRIVNRSQNAMNRVVRANNKSGVPGVYYRKQESLWIANVMVNKKRVIVGRFKNFEDAVVARKEAEDKYYNEYSYNNSQQYALNNKISENGDAI